VLNREIFKISKVGSIAGCMVMDVKLQEMQNQNYQRGVVA
jgi:hypothetical protein